MARSLSVDTRLDTRHVDTALARAECSVRSEVRAETQVFPSSGTPLLGLKESRPTARCAALCFVQPSRARINRKS